MVMSQSVKLHLQLAFSRFRNSIEFLRNYLVNRLPITVRGAAFRGALAAETVHSRLDD